MKRIIVPLLISILLTNCTTYVINKPNDPCENKTLISLEKKDSLTNDEMKIYLELKRLCIENQNAEELNYQTERIADATWLGVLVYVTTIIGVLVWAVIDAGK